MYAVIPNEVYGMKLNCPITIIPETIKEYNEYRFLKKDKLYEIWGHNNDKKKFTFYIQESEYLNFVNQIRIIKNESPFDLKTIEFSNSVFTNMKGENMYQFNIRMKRNIFETLRYLFIENKNLEIQLTEIFIYSKVKDKYYISGLLDAIGQVTVTNKDYSYLRLYKPVTPIKFNIPSEIKNDHLVIEI